MRTTVDVPDDLLRRARPLLADRNMTFRALVVDALQKVIEETPATFKLRDASAGAVTVDGGVTSDAINFAIDQSREPTFRG